MIKRPLKKCKGTQPSTKDWGCGRETPRRKYGLGTGCCYTKWLLESEEGQKRLKNAELKATKPRREFEKSAKEYKERKGLTTLIKDTVKVFHKYIRERDKYKPCIACRTAWKEDFDASHYYKAELYSSLKFNELNVHGGCIACNRRKEGNLSEYTERLPLRIGQVKLNELNKLAQLDKKTNHKWDREELLSLRKHYREKQKELHTIS